MYSNVTEEKNNDEYEESVYVGNHIEWKACNDDLSPTCISIMIDEETESKEDEDERQCAMHYHEPQRPRRRSLVYKVIGGLLLFGSGVVVGQTTNTNTLIYSNDHNGRELYFSKVFGFFNPEAKIMNYIFKHPKLVLMKSFAPTFALRFWLKHTKAGERFEKAYKAKCGDHTTDFSYHPDAVDAGKYLAKVHIHMVGYKFTSLKNSIKHILFHHDVDAKDLDELVLPQYIDCHGTDLAPAVAPDAGTKAEQAEMEKFSATLSPEPDAAASVSSIATGKQLATRPASAATTDAGAIAAASKADMVKEMPVVPRVAVPVL